MKRVIGAVPSPGARRVAAHTQNLWTILGFGNGQIPVVSHPAGLGAGRTAAFQSLQLSALGPVARTYPLTTTIHFSGFNSAACVLASPLLRTSSLDDRTSVRLPTRWLAFGRVGFVGCRRRTHWVTMTSFKGCHPYSNVPGFSRHEQRMVRRTATFVRTRVHRQSSAKNQKPRLRERPIPAVLQLDDSSSTVESSQGDVSSDVAGREAG